MTILTEEQQDEVFRLKEELWAKVHDLVDEHLALAPSTIDYEVRQQMTEQFRFWRRFS